MPAMIDQSIFGWWGRRRELRRQAAAILERVGLGHRLKHKPRELSGGEMQRAAIARALIGRPRVLLADEPTGNLDAETGGEIIRLLRRLNRDEGLTIVMVTHNLDLVAATDRVVRITAGRIEAAGRPAEHRLGSPAVSEACSTTTSPMALPMTPASGSTASSTTRPTPRSASTTTACSTATASSKASASTTARSSGSRNTSSGSTTAPARSRSKSR